MADIREFSKDLNALERACKSGKFLHEAAQYVRGAAVGLCPAMTGTLRTTIGYSITSDGDISTAHIGTNSEYAMYVEFGTGPKGAANHAGISPEVNPAYRMSPWWVHESMLDPDAIDYYGWYSIRTKDGVFYKIQGQAAQPFLYPALKDNEQTVNSIVENGIIGALRR